VAQRRVNQVAASDVELLLLAIAGELQNLHAIQQCRVQRAELVRRGDEQHPRQVVRHLEIVIAEGVVLRGVEDLQKSGSRIALESDRDLVHFVQHEHGV
jgi:hypothetical protein